jgi:hypothetical protein
VKLLTGKEVEALPNSVVEWMFASEYGWDLATIRALSPQDYKRHIVCLTFSKQITAKKSFT